MKYIALVLTLMVALTAPGIAVAEESVTLRRDITVEGDRITLGDLFMGAGDKADLVIAPSPAPGKTTVFKAVSVARFIQSKGLEWRPATPIRRITVRRLGASIPQQVIDEQLRAALEYEMQLELFEMSLATQNLNIQIAANEPQTVSVENLYLNKTSGQFVAEILAPAHSENGQRVRISGQVHPQTMIPVLKRFKPAGEEIRESDIDYMAERTSKVGRQVVTDAAFLIGKSPRRSVRSGQPVSMSNLGDPVLVGKGKLVSVILEHGGMYLSVTGRTLEAGGEEDVIRVENINSRKVILAQVISAQEVRIVTRPPQLASANTVEN
ncbi:flagellar basal body P-ring formation protein FlgA [Sneathiella chungangensis]|uniref:Flagellar basal body P-ring formation protein FlgA n=1 Tax=Sneathiella chungangensis TaxID=1418234 RepID=A0A845MBM8_9PROT|nr:flagellar basal body P-ring formation chaperone FlgA [Sneathiella chungangensis]MZR21245.1 flagellar basal body P-ring formation protein FlgA [Sneathiella chungangensis]